LLIFKLLNHQQTGISIYYILAQCTLVLVITSQRHIINILRRSTSASLHRKTQQAVEVLAVTAREDMVRSVTMTAPGLLDYWHTGPVTGTHWLLTVSLIGFNPFLLKVSHRR